MQVKRLIAVAAASAVLFGCTRATATPFYGTAQALDGDSLRVSNRHHVPGMPYYARTNAEEMFCSEAEAKAAGYRRARAR